MIRNTCAFTGHRPHKFPWKTNEADPRCAALKAVLVEQVGKLVAAGATDFYSGMADGSDVWLSQIVLNLRKKNPTLKLHCFLPCEGQADKYGHQAGHGKNHRNFRRSHRHGDFLQWQREHYHPGNRSGCEQGHCGHSAGGPGRHRPDQSEQCDRGQGQRLQRAYLCRCGCGPYNCHKQ